MKRFRLALLALAALICFGLTLSAPAHANDTNYFSISTLSDVPLEVGAPTIDIVADAALDALDMKQAQLEFDTQHLCAANPRLPITKLPSTTRLSPTSPAAGMTSLAMNLDDRTERGYLWQGDLE